ncbi:hypothetical protein E4U52_000954 [Claviceps spartinae]|nr:hypothetical protein E4U52_000954 [Claviceps spartinae]
MTDFRPCKEIPAADALSRKAEDLYTQKEIQTAHSERRDPPTGGAGCGQPANPADRGSLTAKTDSSPGPEQDDRGGLKTNMAKDADRRVPLHRELSNLSPITSTKRQTAGIVAAVGGAGETSPAFNYGLHDILEGKTRVQLRIRGDGPAFEEIL